MAIAHIATEYVFSDFLLKEPPETRYKGLRLELALDKIVTCIAVGLPLLLISLAFAQEVSIGNRPPPRPPPAPRASRGGQRARRGGGRRSGAELRGGGRSAAGAWPRLPGGEVCPLGGGGKGAFGARGVRGRQRSSPGEHPWQQAVPPCSLTRVRWASRLAFPALPMPSSSSSGLSLTPAFSDTS